MSKHAVLSASGAHRWLACPPSALIESKLPDKGSIYASEGTFAHELAEKKLRKATIPTFHIQFNHWYEMTKRNNQYYSQGLEEYVDEYVDTVLEKVQKHSILKIEDRLDFSAWVPGGFGTGDAVIINDGNIEVVDLKYGAHVQVSALDNPQLRLYALGAYEEYQFLYDFDTITMTIVQPRNGGVSSETMTVDELLAWGEEVKKTATIAIEGKGEMKAGEHCQFCKAKEQCKVLKDYMLKGIEPSKGIDELMPIEEISDLFKRADSIISYLNNVKAFCLDQALQGRKIPGFKLVEGRAVRKYSDEQSVINILYKEYGSKIYKPAQLIGITDMQKLLGRKKFDSLLSGFLIKPPGKPTLAPESDKRPEYNAAANDFESLD